MTTTDWQRLCPVAELQRLAQDGLALRFEVAGPHGPVPAFALWTGGEPRAFLNRCAHVPVELDGEPGRFWDETGQVIVCATHGAVYDPASGHCIRGPCRGKRLHPVVCREAEGWIESGSIGPPLSY